MSIQWMAKVLDFEHPDLDSGMKFVLLGLANHTNPPNQCFPSVRLLMKYTGQCERAVRSNIRKLEAAGLLEVQKRPQKTSIYLIKIDGAECAPRGADDAPHGADDAPEPLLNRKIPDASDARAFDDDWKPSAEIVHRIATQEGLSEDEIERERRMFVLKCMAGSVPAKPDAAFRAWCARVKSLKHEPKAPPPRPTGAPRNEGPVDRLALLRKTRKLYERMGRTEDLPELDAQIAAMEAQHDKPDDPDQ